MVKTTKRVTANTKSARKSTTEMDSSYFLKLVLYLVLGTQWLFVTNDTASWQIPLPIGLVVGILFARHERFQIDRKIEYAVLLVSTLVGFWAQVGLQLIV